MEKVEIDPKALFFWGETRGEDNETFSPRKW